MVSSEDVTQELILRTVVEASKPLTVRGISTAIRYHTNTPWTVVFRVQELERAGLVTWQQTRPWHVEITDAGRQQDAEGGG